MSYQSWHNYGYGICVDDIDTDFRKIERLISLAPKFNSEFEESLELWMDGNYGYDAFDIDLDDLYEILYDMDLSYGLADVLSRVIEEVEGIRLVACDDYDSIDYLIFPAGLPWDFNDKERHMTEKSVEELFRKYVGILSEKEIDIEWKSIENGG